MLLCGFELRSPMAALHNRMDSEAEEAATHQLPISSSPDPPRRSTCSNCRRPTPVCLCHALPTHPIKTTTRVFILHHPHEANHKLSTTPILTKSLLHANAVTGRRLRRGVSPLFDQFPRAIYLFPATPSSPAVNISDLKPSELTGSDDNGGLVLIAFDATWKHAREMVKASEAFLSKFAIRVCLGVEDEKVGGGSIYDSELILRKEPFGGCVSTMEAVARALRVLEPNGLEIEAQLVGILREMVRLQAGFLKPMNPRPKVLKKKKLKEVKQDVDLRRLVVVVVAVRRLVVDLRRLVVLVVDLRRLVVDLRRLVVVVVDLRRLVVDLRRFLLFRPDFCQLGSSHFPQCALVCEAPFLNSFLFPKLDPGVCQSFLGC